MHWNLMVAGFFSYSLYLLLLVIDCPNQYNAIHCKLTNKNSVYNKWYHTYRNSLENLNQFIDKFTKKLLQCMTIDYRSTILYGMTTLWTRLAPTHISNDILFCQRFLNILLINISINIDSFFYILNDKNMAFELTFHYTYA